MKTNLLTFCIFLGSFFSISLAYGDDIPTQGRWDDEDYRSITALPPTLSINNNVLIIIRRAGKEDETFMNRIKDYIHEGKVDSALNLCRSTNTPSARMIEKGITRLGRPMNDVLVAIENVGNLEIAKLEKGFPLIATTAAGAPMLGFLGTVTGMVRAFFDMANAGTNVDVSLLSGGIYEALVTTVGGLVVGIITLFAYNYLVSQVDNVVNKMEARTMEFMDLLNEPAN